MTTKLPPLADLLDLVPDAVCVVDAEGRFLFVSASFERILGYTSDEVVGRRVFDLVHPDDKAATMQQAEKVMAGLLQRHFRNRYLHKDGHTVDLQWSARWHPEYQVRIAVGHEVSELRQAERELEHRASHDPLTGLPNRRLLQRALQCAITHAAETNGGLTVLYLDLDGFKAVNDRSGHGAGDRILQEVAQRLVKDLRQDDLVARVGGDEFVVLLPGCRDAGTASNIADKLRARLRAPCELPDGPIHLDVSVGIACYPTDGKDPETLMVHADHAMYAVRRLLEQRGANER